VTRVYIDRIGLEIEGCWAGKAGESPFDFPLKQDISVHQIGDYPHVGEASTPEPLPRADARGWLRAHWPAASDTYCGMHAHASIVDPIRNYGRLACQEFFDHLLKRLDQWGDMKGFNPHHPYMHRLKGCKDHLTPDGRPLNRFCTRTFDPSTQMKLKEKNSDARRSILNFCYEMHGTIECRVWPMFTEGPDLAADAVEVFFTAIEDFLVDQDKLETNGFSLPIRPGRARERVVAPPPNGMGGTFMVGGGHVPPVNPHWTAGLPAHWAGVGQTLELLPEEDLPIPDWMNDDD
jgi:hypothetical protein